MDVIAQIVECPRCHRKFVVSNMLIGVSHTVGIQVVCLDCVDEDKREAVIKLYSKPTLVPQPKSA